TVTLRLLALPGPHQHRWSTGDLGGRQIAQAIANRWNAVHLHAVTTPDFLQPSGARLATFTARIGGVRTKEHRVDATASERERLVHLLVDRVEAAHVEQPATHTRLVRGNDHAKSRVV